MTSEEPNSVPEIKYPYAGYSWKSFVGKRKDFAHLSIEKMFEEPDKRFPEIEIDGEKYRIVKSTLDIPAIEDEETQEVTRRAFKRDYYYILPRYELEKDWNKLVLSGVNFLKTTTERFNFCIKYFLQGKPAGKLLESVAIEHKDEVAATSVILAGYFEDLIKTSAIKQDIRVSIKTATDSIAQMFFVAFYDDGQDAYARNALNPQDSLRAKLTELRERIEVKRAELQQFTGDSRIVRAKEAEVEYLAFRICACQNSLMVIDSMKLIMHGYRHYVLDEDITENVPKIQQMRGEISRLYTEISNAEDEKGVGITQDSFLRGIIGEDDKNFMWVELAGEYLKAATPLIPINAKGELKTKDEAALNKVHENATTVWLHNKIGKIGDAMRDLSRAEDIAKSMIRRIEFAVSNGVADIDAEVLNRAKSLFRRYEVVARRFITISSSDVEEFARTREQMVTVQGELHDVTMHIREKLNPDKDKEHTGSFERIGAEASMLLVSCRKLMLLFCNTKRGNNVKAARESDRESNRDSVIDPAITKLEDLCIKGREVVATGYKSKDLMGAGARL